MEDQTSHLRPWHPLRAMEHRLRPPLAGRSLLSRVSILGETFLNQYIVRVSAAIRRPGDEILAARQLDRGLERINLPGGMAHFNESPKQALVREVCEETGFEVIPTEIAFVCEGASERCPNPTLDIYYTRRSTGNRTT